MNKNVLIIGLNSELASETIKELKKKNYNIWATSRHIGVMDEKIIELHLDITKDEDFIHLKDKINGVQFDTIANFAGIAIAGAVEELSEVEYKKQFDVNLFGLLRIIKYFCPYLKPKGKLVNVSSMASYGIFPFLSPYSISKSAADILLNNYAIESNIKVVSIRPGAIATKFWESSIELNENNLKNQNTKFQKEKEFLVKNAQKNSLHAKNAINTGKKIAKIIDSKYTKTVYNIGIDSKIAKLTRFIPQDLVNFLIKTTLKVKISKK